MVTGEQVFKIAMSLMDEVQRDGKISTSDTQSYRAKTPSLLTVLQTELMGITETPVVVTDLNAPLSLPDRVCLLTLPYGLAAHLSLTEDETIASYFNQRYEELRRKTPTRIEPIKDVYGIAEGMK